jgi:hypothetical protein
MNQEVLDHRSHIMSHLARLVSHVTALFCDHEWARRVEGRRVYLECVHCLSTTPGFETGPRERTSARPPRPELHAAPVRTVQAA